MLTEVSATGIFFLLTIKALADYHEKTKIKKNGASPPPWIAKSLNELADLHVWHAPELGEQQWKNSRLIESIDKLVEIQQENAVQLGKVIDAIGRVDLKVEACQCRAEVKAAGG